MTHAPLITLAASIIFAGLTIWISWIIDTDDPRVHGRLLPSLIAGIISIITSFAATALYITYLAKAGWEGVGLWIGTTFAAILSIVWCLVIFLGIECAINSDGVNEKVLKMREDE